MARGELALFNDDYPLALTWYEAACRLTTFFDHDAIIDPALRRERLMALRKLATDARSVLRGAPSRHLFVIQAHPDRVGRASGALCVQLGRQVEVTVDTGRVGQAKTFFSILEGAWRAEVDFLTLFEDDILPARGLLGYIQHTIIDDDLVLMSWFSDREWAPQTYRPQITIVPTEDYCFHQAITLPRWTIAALLDSAVVKTWSEPHGADRVYAKALPGQLCGVHYPNLVQHIGGNESVVGNMGMRRSPTFIGEEADARDLAPGFVEGVRAGSGYRTVR